MMKRLSLKHLLVMVFVGLLAMSGTVWSDQGPGTGMAPGELGNEFGDPVRARTGECCPKEFLGVSEAGGNGQCGNNCGEGQQKQKGRDSVELLGECEEGCQHHQHMYKGTK